MELNDSKRFKKVYMEISNICNLKCTFCPEVERAQWKIEMDKFISRLRAVKPFADRVCFHVMGEPLGHPLFAEFLEIAAAEEVQVEITTNGTLLTEEIKQALLSPAVVQVNFSLQSFIDNFPKASPEGYLKKIFAFCRIAFEQRPDLYLNFRLWNLGDAQGQDERNQNLLDRIEKEFQVKINRTVDPAFRKSKQVMNRLYLHFDSRFIWPKLSDAPISAQGRCYGGRSHVAVLAEGTIVPCCLDKEAVMGFGNLDQDRFDDLLQTPRYKNLISGFEQGKMNEALCQRCDYAQRFTKN